MMWPGDLNEVECVNFDSNILPYIRNALNAKAFRSHADNFTAVEKYGEFSCIQFDLLGHRYESQQRYGVVHRVMRVGTYHVVDDDGAEAFVKAPEVKPIGDYGEFGSW